MPNYTKIVELGAQEEDTTYNRLSPTTRFLLGSFLNDLVEAPTRWYGWVDGQAEDLSDEDLRAAQDLTELAMHEIFTEVSMAYIGEVRMFASEVPNGWLHCLGQEASREDYADLFAAIGTTFGAGDGTTTFNLPDAGGRSPQGYDSESEALGAVLGTKMQTQVPQHRHTVPRQSATATRASVTMGTGAIYLDTTDTGQAGGVDQRGPRFVVYFGIYAGVFFPEG